MTRNDAILWFGRIATIALTVAIVLDMTRDAHLSQEIRRVVLGTVAVTVLSMFVWQGRVAYRYDGWPWPPFAFRWVVWSWLGSLGAFIVWLIVSGVWPTLYSDYRSAVMWWQFGVMTLWFASRWVTVETPHQAGVGETGSTPGNGGTV